MANKILIKRSAVADKVPATTDLDLGEFAINTYDGKVFIKKSDGTNESIVEIGSTKLISSTADPTSTDQYDYGTFWVNSNTNILFTQVSQDETTPDWRQVGVAKFSDLQDVDLNYTGNAGKAVVVNDTEDGLTFVNNTDSESVYTILLAVSEYENITFSVFDSTPDLIMANDGTYDSADLGWVYNTNQSFTTDNIITDGSEQGAFQIFINTVQDTANLKVEYSTDGGSTFIEVTDPTYRVYLNPSTTDFRIKMTSLVDGTLVQGFGVLYKLDGSKGSSNVAFDVNEKLTENIPAGTDITLPNSVYYNNDEKSLNVWRNGVKLISGIHYEEINNTQIRTLIDLAQDDYMEYKQYLGYVFIDQNNVASGFVKEWIYRDVNGDYTTMSGEYIFADTSSAGFTITLPSNPATGDTVMILDATGTIGTDPDGDSALNYVYLNGNGNTVLGSSDNVTLDVTNKEYKIIFNSLHNDWKVI